MKTKRLLMCLGILSLLVSGCARTSGKKGKKSSSSDSDSSTSATTSQTSSSMGPSIIDKITVWVDRSTAETYSRLSEQFLKDNPSFGYKISIEGSDTGTNAGALLNDPYACADVVCIAHDNIGKLAQARSIKPFNQTDLINQVINDNSGACSDLMFYSEDLEAEEEKCFASPCQFQSLFLYYNTKYVTEEQAMTFEGLEEAAASIDSQTKSFAVAGTDGYNCSFALLAKNKNTKTSTLKLYENRDIHNCYAQGDDIVATTKWFQRSALDENGFLQNVDSTWDSILGREKVLSIIGGSWMYDAAETALRGNIGIAPLPSFTVNEDDVEGTAVPAGTVFQAASFADYKTFVINAASSNDKYSAIQQLIKYLSSKDVQNELLINDGMVPSYLNSEIFIDEHKDEMDEVNYRMIKAQLFMLAYGIPQPFIDSKMNNYYYAKFAPNLYYNCVTNVGGAYNTTWAVRETLYKMQYIWECGKTPDYVPSELPADIEF